MATRDIELAEYQRIRRRVEVFSSWVKCSTEELVGILEYAIFPEPMDTFHGRSFIIQHLYLFRSHELTESELERLEAIASSTSPSPLEHSPKEKLECYLAVLRNDAARLKRFWEGHQGDWSVWDAMTTAAGDLRSTDPQIIAGLISVVETSLMFGPRRAAVIALGKIGRAVGARAAEVISREIYDSSEEIAQLKQRVLARLSTAEADWQRCQGCASKSRLAGKAL
jgi:hypothetical protein